MRMSIGIPTGIIEGITLSALIARGISMYIPILVTMGGANGNVKNVNNNLTMSRKTKLLQSDCKEVIERYQNGETAATIAKTYGVTPQSVIVLLRREGVGIRVRRSKLTRSEYDKQNRQILEMFGDGMPLYLIADKLGIAVSLLGNRLDSLGIQFRSKRRTSDEIETVKLQFKAMYSNGTPYNQIKEDLRASSATLSKWRKELGIVPRKPRRK